jgi:hypothetical protein
MKLLLGALSLDVGQSGSCSEQKVLPVTGAISGVQTVFENWQK